MCIRDRSDGKAKTEGELNLNLQPQGNLAPVANGDFYVGRVGEEVLIQPLANDTDPNGDTLSLVRVSSAKDGATAEPDLEGGTITFAASVPRTYYLNSVSYTHLDVYKRQVLKKAGLLTRDARVKERKKAGLKTVSYTHLDVYKRQVQSTRADGATDVRRSPLGNRTTHSWWRSQARCWAWFIRPLRRT